MDNEIIVNDMSLALLLRDTLEKMVIEIQNIV